MRKNKKYFLIPIIVLLSLAIIYFGSELLAMYRLGLKKVCVAKMNLKERTLIDEEYIDYIYVPKAYINENTYTEANDVVGKYVKLNSTIYRNSLFYKDALDDTDNMKDLLHLNLNESEVTYDLFIKDIKVNTAHLLEGMNVDIYLTINRKEVISDLLISNARIIGLYDLNNKEIKNMNSDYTVGTISIALNKEMVPYLNKAIAIGEVSLLVTSDVYKQKEMNLNDSSNIFDYIR